MPDQSERSATILVVDDDQFMRKSIAAALRGRNWTILEAVDGQQGLDLFTSSKPDLLLIDLKMPVMDGLELLSALGAATSRTPVLVISGVGGLDEALEAIHRGAWDYLIKPIASAAVLQHAVDKALERAGLIRENEAYRRNLERQVQERTRDLEKANRDLEHQILKQQKLAVIGTLAGGMAHDFNNILSAVVCSTEVVRSALESGDPADSEDLERIVRVCQRGTALIRSVLHFTGKMHEEFALFPVLPTLRETLDLIRRTTPPQITITAELEPDLGCLFGDPVHLQQIIMNVAANAVHALVGTRHPHITITAALVSDPILHPDSMQTVITVTDNGPGVPDEHISRLCEPFFTTKPKDQGTGLGLFVTQKIIKTLRGSLYFSHANEGGMAVRIGLPVSLSDTVQEIAQAGALPGNQERILLIESNREVRQAISSCLNALGYRITRASTHTLGLELLRAAPDAFDLVLAEEYDFGQTAALCAGIHAAAGSLPLILTRSDATEVSASLQTGVSAVLSKPVDIATLTRTLHDCLHQMD